MNSELYDKTYKLPSDVLKHLQMTLASNSHGEGVKRAKFLLKNGEVTYSTLKRLKNFFDHYNGESPQQYELAGGELMKSFVERTLGTERDGVSREKEIKRDMNVDLNLATKPQQTPRVNDSLNEDNDGAIDGPLDGVKQNALAIIINDDKQILLLKRSDVPDIWQPGKWALVGGAVEEGETPVIACQREIKEETGLIVEKFREKFTIQRNPDSIEYIFIAKYDGDPHSIKLNEEHSRYGWYSPEEIYFLNHVPNLIEYVNIAFKKYD